MVHWLYAHSGNTQLSLNEENKTKRVTAAAERTAGRRDHGPGWPHLPAGPARAGGRAGGVWVTGPAGLAPLPPRRAFRTRKRLSRSWAPRQRAQPGHSPGCLAYHQSWACWLGAARTRPHTREATAHSSPAPGPWGAACTQPSEVVNCIKSLLRNKLLIHSLAFSRCFIH